MTAIAAKGLSKQFGTQKVLANLDLAIPGGSVYGLVGRNGAGKTTLLRLAVGLLRPSAGEIRVLGRDPVTASAAEKVDVAYVGDPSVLPDWMQLRDVTGFEGAVRPELNLERLKKYLEAQRLGETREINSLSKGQRRRLDLELALAGSPQLLILDEPFDGLDPVSRAEAMEALVTHRGSAQRTVLVSSQLLTDLDRICDRIGVLAGGQIRFDAELHALKESVALVFGGKANSADDKLPVEAAIIGARSDERGRTWLVRALDSVHEAKLQQAGFQVSWPGLEELGLELIRCLDPRGANQ